jgi:hypothetical protein
MIVNQHEITSPTSDLHLRQWLIHGYCYLCTRGSIPAVWLSYLQYPVVFSNTWAIKNYSYCRTSGENSLELIVYLARPALLGTWGEQFVEGLRWCNHQSNLWDGFRSRCRVMILMRKEPKSTLCRKSWVFSGYSGFLPQGMLTGWVGINPPNWPFHRSCAQWSDMSHKVAARGALRKPLTRSGWAASFAIQLSSQLPVRILQIDNIPLTFLTGTLATYKIRT